MGIIGTGKTFGDIDAYRRRGYLYTLRSASSNVLLYEIDAKDFIMHIKSIGNKNEFKKWQKREDQAMINKLSANLAHKFQGMNIDGISNA